MSGTIDSYLKNIENVNLIIIYDAQKMLLLKYNNR